MELCSSTLLPNGASLESPSGGTWYSRIGHWLASARSHRILCVLAGIWLLNGFDLILTVLAHNQGLLHEENPVARFLLDQGTFSIVTFKIGLVMIGSYPLLRFRHARITELGSFVILISYALLAVHWSECYKLYAITASSSLHMADLAKDVGL